MLIPETTTKPNTLYEFQTMEDYNKLRTATTDKLLFILVKAEWDDSSKLLEQMVTEMPS